MSTTSTRKAETDIPVLKREQLGKGVRGKYLHQFSQGSNVVVLQPEIFKAFPTSEAVNQALANLLTVTRETVRLTSRSGGRPKRDARQQKLQNEPSLVSWFEKVQDDLESEAEDTGN